MQGNALYRIIADIVLMAHIAFVGFVVLGLGLIILGGLQRWAWIRNPRFRFSHLAAIGVVVAQAWIGVICPLTNLEMALRERARDVIYAGSFVAFWLQRLLYYEWPAWVFTVCYTSFGILVMGAWFIFRPRPIRRRGPEGAGRHLHRPHGRP
jgi:hypothetical protein